MITGQQYQKKYGARMTVVGRIARAEIWHALISIDLW